MSRGERKAMITRDAPELSLSRQCRLLSIGRSSFYYAPRGESPSSLALMRRIDELFMKYPFYGSRQMVRQLRRDGVCVGRHRVRRLMRLIGLEAIYQAPRTSVPHPMHRIYPYLLKGMAIDQPNRVWCADITYIPVQRGFLYLVAIMDWATRHVLSWRLSNTMDAGFCAGALGDALARYGQPEIFNTDQGSQFTSLDFTGVHQEREHPHPPWHGRGRCMDNIFIELPVAVSQVMRRSTYTALTDRLPRRIGSSASGSACYIVPSGPIRPSTVKRRPRPTGPVNLWISSPTRLAPCPR